MTHAPEPPKIKCLCGEEIECGLIKCQRCTDKENYDVCKCGRKIRKIETKCTQCREKSEYNTKDPFVFYEPIETFGLINAAAVDPEKIKKLYKKVNRRTYKDIETKMPKNEKKIKLKNCEEYVKRFLY